MSQKLKTNNCDECGSLYYSEKSKMTSMCPECSHQIYGYENCVHIMENGRCKNCYWDGSQSSYIKSKNNE